VRLCPNSLADLSVIHQKVYAIAEGIETLRYYELYNMNVASIYEGRVEFRMIGYPKHVDNVENM
jgi:hypothetical protein